VPCCTFFVPLAAPNPRKRRFCSASIVLSHVIGTFDSNRIYTVGRVVKVEDLMRWRFAPRGFDSLRISMQNSHVIGTFDSNRIYTVGRVVKVEDLMRWRFAPRGFDSLRISMQNSSANTASVHILGVFLSQIFDCF